MTYKSGSVVRTHNLCDVFYLLRLQPIEMNWLTLPQLVLLVSFIAHTNSDLLPYEPLEMLKTYLPKQAAKDESPWSKFKNAGSHELKNWTSVMKKNVRTHLSKAKDVSVLFLKGEEILIEKLAHQMKRNSSITIPYANVMSVIGVTLPILLENYKSSILTDPIGKILKGPDRQNPVVSGHEKLSCLDLLNKLPETDDSSNILEDPQVMQALNSRGKLLLYVSNTVLGKSAREAWLDALLSVGMEEARIDNNGPLVTSLNDLTQYVFTILHGFEVGPAAPKSEAYSPDTGRYLFSWWFNCPVGGERGDCLLPRLPPDTVFNLSPGLRIYISAHLHLSLIITNRSSGSQAKQSMTIADILHEDRHIWDKIYSVIDPTPQNTEPKLEETKDAQKAWTWTSWLWPILVFLFFILSSHIWVYWMFHAFWYVVGFFVKRTHIPRPKTAKQD